MAIPTTTIRIPIMARVRLERRLSVSSIGRNASNGVTAVAERADPMDASTVTTMPKRMGTTAACQEKLNRIPACMMSLTHMPHMSRLPSTTPSTDATKPSTAASNSTEPYSWPFFAPIVRSKASVRRRCATSTWNVLAITRAATNMASTPKHIRNVVAMLVWLPLKDLMLSSLICCRDIRSKCFGSNAFTPLMVFADTLFPSKARSRYTILVPVALKSSTPCIAASRLLDPTIAPP